MKKYKILLVTHEFPPNIIGGMGIHAYYLGIELKKLGNHVSILTSKITKKSFSENEFTLDGLNIVRLKHSTFPNIRESFLKKAIKYINDNDNFDVIHGHNFLDYSRVKTLALKIQKVHLNPVYSYQFNKLGSLFESLYIKNIKKIRIKSLVKRSLRNSDLVIYNSNLSRKITENTYKNKFKNKVIYNGVNYKEFQTQNKDLKRKGILFIGGNKERKGADIVVKAARKLKKFKFKIAGCSEKDFRKYYSCITVPDNIKFLGYLSRSQMVKEYSKAQALIHPARYESFGNVILESLACGTPVLVSNSKFCGASEILDNFVAVTFNPNNIEEIKQKIIYFFDNTDRYKIEACKKIAENYIWKRTAVETDKLIKKFSKL